MMNDIKIPFEVLTLAYQRPTDSKECYVSLYDKYLLFHVDFLADEPTEGDDWGTGTTNRINYFHVMALKEFIAGVELSYTLDKKWRIVVSTNGIASDIRLYFKAQVKAEYMFDRILNWLNNE